VQRTSRPHPLTCGARSWRSLLGMLCALVLIVSSCGAFSSSEVSTSGQSSDNPSQDDSYAPSDPVRVEEEPVSQQERDFEYESPIAEFFGQDTGSFEFDEAAMIEMQREAERLITACMIGQGFEYTPPDMSQMMGFMGPPDFEVDRDSPEWTEIYGFGITTQRFPQSMVGDLVGFPDIPFNEPDFDFVDPNQEYVDGLSDGERDAYYAALYGQPTEFEGDVIPDPSMFEPSGCQAEAFMNGPGGFGDENMRDFQEAFGDQMQSLYDRIESDSRIVAFNAEISACVSESGMNWTNMKDLRKRFESRLNDLQPDMMRNVDPFAEAGLNPEEMSERELDEFYTEMNRLSPEALFKLGELQSEEIALAKAVTDCGGGPKAGEQLFQEVRVELEQAFVDDNAEALAEFAPDN